MAPALLTSTAITSPAAGAAASSDPRRANKEAPSDPRRQVAAPLDPRRNPVPRSPSPVSRLLAKRALSPGEAEFSEGEELEDDKKKTKVDQVVVMQLHDGLLFWNSLKDGSFVHCCDFPPSADLASLRKQGAELFEETQRLVQSIADDHFWFQLLKTVSQEANPRLVHHLIRASATSKFGIPTFEGDRLIAALKQGRTDRKGYHNRMQYILHLMEGTNLEFKIGRDQWLDVIRLRDRWNEVTNGTLREATELLKTASNARIVMVGTEPLLLTFAFCYVMGFGPYVDGRDIWTTTGAPAGYSAVVTHLQTSQYKDLKRIGVLPKIIDTTLSAACTKILPIDTNQQKADAARELMRE